MEHSQRVKQAKLEALRRRRAPAKRTTSNRLVRTILLGSAAVVLALAWLVREFQLDTDELMGFLGVSAVLVLASAACGALGFALVWLIKRMR